MNRRLRDPVSWFIIVAFSLLIAGIIFGAIWSQHSVNHHRDTCVERGLVAVEKLGDGWTCVHGVDP